MATNKRLRKTSVRSQLESIKSQLLNSKRGLNTIRHQSTLRSAQMLQREHQKRSKKQNAIKRQVSFMKSQGTQINPLSSLISFQNCAFRLITKREQVRLIKSLQRLTPRMEIQVQLLSIQKDCLTLQWSLRRNLLRLKPLLNLVFFITKKV